MTIEFNTISNTFAHKIAHKFSFEHIFTKKHTSPEQKELVEQAQLFLDSNNYEAYATMLSKGYKPTDKQITIMRNFVNSVLLAAHNETNTQENYIKLEKFLTQGFTLDYYNAIAFFINDNYYFTRQHLELFLKDNFVISVTNHNYDNSKEFPALTQALRNVINQPDFCNYFLYHFLKQLSTKLSPTTKKIKTYEQHYEEVFAQYYNVFIWTPHLLFKNMPFKDFLTFNKKFQKMDLLPRTKDSLNKVANNFYKKDMDRIFEQTKITYTNNLVDKLTINTIKNEIHSMKDLPKNALTIISAIEELYKKIKTAPNNHTNNKYIENIEQLELMLEKRIPEVLSKYLTIDPSYRTTLVSSQGKNAEQLMIESLENIKAIFDKTFETINQHNIDSLSVTNRYTQALVT
jgi:hypothetical protein